MSKELNKAQGTHTHLLMPQLVQEDSLWRGTSTKRKRRGKMKRTVFIIALCLSLTIPSMAIAEALTIATFNVEFLIRPKVHVKFGLPFNMNDASPSDQAQWAVPGFRDQKFNEAAKAVAKVITDMNADVLALVEVGDRTDVDELNREIQARGVTYAHIALCDCTDTITQQRVAVLSKLPLSDIVPAIPGREYYDLEMDETEEEDDTAVSKGMRVTFQASNQQFLLYVVHLSSEVGGHEKDAQRLAQASIVRRHYLPALNADKHVIIAGDMNADRGEPAVQRLRGRDDIWEDLIETGHYSFFETAQQNTRWTYEFRGIRQQLDHILISQSVKKASSSIKPRTIEITDRVISDHRPFVLLLNLR
jgi:endonuclease/exonuclease/phosphatase family metal-dependent hydrolase